MSEEAPCRYCGHWDEPTDEKTYCLKHYRRTFFDRGCDMCELEQRIHNACEVYAGMEGFTPDSCAEKYLVRVIEQMYRELQEKGG